MEELPKATTQRILNSFPEQQKKYLVDLLKGKVRKRVKCMSEDVFEGKGKNKTLIRPGCKGRIIAYIDVDESVREVFDGENPSYLLASRRRLDGFMGFQCVCGNDSRLCAQEMGNKGIETGLLTKKDVVDVIKKVDIDQPNYPVIKGVQNIDNFIVEDVE